MFAPGARFDEHRNTSRVFPVPPDALPAFLAAAARWRAENPAMATWLADGHPHLTETDHLARFGESWRKR